VGAGEDDFVNCCSFLVYVVLGCLCAEYSSVSLPKFFPVCFVG